MAPNSLKEFAKKEQAALKHLTPIKIIIPITIGVMVLVYLTWRDFDPNYIYQIQWNNHTLFWTAMAVLMVLLRHMAYAYRLRKLTENFLSWMKSIELVFLWEFSSAISPTSLGGSVVAFFLLSKERLKAARTTAVVLYSIILDTMFFAVAVPVFYLLLGVSWIRPGAQNFADLGGWGISLLSFSTFMTLYGAFFFIGVFLHPELIKNFLVWLSRFKWLRKYRRQLSETGDDVILTSQKIKKKPIGYHLSVFGATALGWICRFLLLNFLIIAFVPKVSADLLPQTVLVGRSLAIYLFMAFMPTPGSSGIAEFVFNGFLSDYIPASLSMIVASVWRLLSYYFYLISGVIIIPLWLKRVLSRDR